MRGRKGTGPFGQLAKGLGHKQISARVARKDVEELFAMLKTERMSFNNFVEACVSAYVRSNPSMRAVIEEYRRSAALPTKREARKNFEFDDREREELLRSIESEHSED